MSKINIKSHPPARFTNEGARAVQINPEQQLRRLVLTCLLWEDTFYVDGKSIAEAITETISTVPAEKVRDLAVEAREKQNLRHVPLLLAKTMAGLKTHRHVVADTLARVIQRPDELSEYLALYWDGKRKALSMQSRKGLQRAIMKFNEYQFAKYDRDTAIKLRDVFRIVHPKPKTSEQAELWKKVVDRTLTTPDTWEVALSASQGENKVEVWTRLLKEKRLPAFALLKNLRNMREAHVPEELVFEALDNMSTQRILPFRFISAAKHNPQWEEQIERVMLRSLGDIPKLPGKTIIVVDNSGSMYGTPVSHKSEIDRSEAACALAILARETCQDCAIIVFSGKAVIVPPRRGFALRDGIQRATEHGGTYTEKAVSLAAQIGYDRIIIFTDEQSHSTISDPLHSSHSYLINVANYKNGIGYGRWTHIDGFSEAILKFISEYEQSQ